MTERRVVCSALRRIVIDQRISLIIGPRHHDETMRAQKMIIEAATNGYVSMMSWHDAETGFIDQRGVFMTREEAWVVAEAAGQIVRTGPGFEGPKLFSENLY